MDSGNTSGSMQSSSGGDEEYDSRAAESISALLTTNNNHHTQNDVVHHLPNHHHHHQSAMFDPLSNFFDPVSSSSSPSRPLNPNPFLNLDIVWPKPVRSDPNSADLVSFIPSSQPNFLPNNHQLGQNSTSAAARSSVLAGANSFPAMQIQPEIHTTRPPPPPLGPSSSSSADRTEAVAAPNGGTRNPKKRSRASRRAPTTVLTTDTTNFRAMVQEFTGIPAPPFTSSPFPRTRLDLFGSGSVLRSGPLDPPPPHHHNLLRPFAQKFQQTTPFVNAASSTSSPPPQNSLLNINQNNPVLSFHSLLQNAPPKFPILPKNMLEQDQFGLSHGNINVNVNNVNASQLGGLPNHHPPTTATTTTIPAASVPVTTSANWGSTDQHGIMGSNDNNNNNGNNGNDGNVDEGLLFRSINGGYTSTSTSAAATNGHKLNYSASSSTDFHGSKTEINLSARSEGMVESWICSSD